MFAGMVFTKAFRDPTEATLWSLRDSKVPSYALIYEKDASILIMGQHLYQGTKAFIQAILLILEKCWWVIILLFLQGTKLFIQTICWS